MSKVMEAIKMYESMSDEEKTEFSDYVQKDNLLPRRSEWLEYDKGNKEKAIIAYKIRVGCSREKAIEALEQE